MQAVAHFLAIDCEQLCAFKTLSKLVTMCPKAELLFGSAFSIWASFTDGFLFTLHGAYSSKLQILLVLASMCLSLE
jgi:hypothetical protein